MIHIGFATAIRDVAGKIDESAIMVAIGRSLGTHFDILTSFTISVTF